MRLDSSIGGKGRHAAGGCFAVGPLELEADHQSAGNNESSSRSTSASRRNFARVGSNRIGNGGRSHAILTLKAIQQHAKSPVLRNSNELLLLSCALSVEPSVPFSARSPARTGPRSRPSGDDGYPVTTQCITCHHCRHHAPQAPPRCGHSRRPAKLTALANSFRAETSEEICDLALPAVTRGWYSLHRSDLRRAFAPSRITPFSRCSQ